MAWHLRTSECRVGVVGLYDAGKTVFLTSLLNHLKDHDPDRFRLGAGRVTVRKFQELPTDPGWQPFAYAGHRDSLVFGRKWPRKTTDRSQYVCTFERSDWRFSTARLKLYDMPGERIADAVMAARDYAGWSDHVLGWLRNDTNYRDGSAEFLGLLDRGDADPAALLRAYKVALARLLLQFKPYISPSTFLLDTRGQLARGSDPEAIAAERHAGLGPDDEFAPLPPDVRAARPDLAERFAGRYAAYREQVARPLVAALRDCHALVVLVDVTTILAGGTGMYDDNRQIILDLLDVVDPGETPLGRVLRGASSLLLPHRWRPGGITRIAFVAPKLDQVHPLDRDRMVHLLRRMLEKPVRNRDGLKPLFTNGSAVVSTKVLEEKQRVLGGILTRDEAGRRLAPGEMQKFTVSELPDDWPLQWPAGCYSFPRVYPQMPMRKDYPPEQVNLDRILDFVMG